MESQDAIKLEAKQAKEQTTKEGKKGKKVKNPFCSRKHYIYLSSKSFQSFSLEQCTLVHVNTTTPTPFLYTHPHYIHPFPLLLLTFPLNLNPFHNLGRISHLNLPLCPIRQLRLRRSSKSRQVSTARYCDSRFRPLPLPLCILRRVCYL